MGHLHQTHTHTEAQGPVQKRGQERLFEPEVAETTEDHSKTVDYFQWKAKPCE